MDVIVCKSLLSNREYKMALQCVSTDRKERIEQYMKYEDRCRMLVASIIILGYIYEKKDLNQTINIGYGLYGKPYCIDLEGIQFSISHSGEYVVCAFDLSDVGVDIEQIADIQYQDIVNRFFHRNEKQILNDLATLSGFYMMWTIKEAYLKYLGDGLNKGMNSFEVRLGETITIVDPENHLEDRVQIETRHMDNEYVISLVGRNKGEWYNISKKQLTQVLYFVNSKVLRLRKDRDAK